MCGSNACLSQTWSWWRRPRTRAEARPQNQRSARSAESPEIIRLGLVGPAAEVEAARGWLPRLNGLLVSTEGNSRRFRDYPGAPRAFAARFEVDSRFIRLLDNSRLQFALASRPGGDRFENLLELYDGRISSLFTDKRPDCILVCLPEELATMRIANPRLNEAERRALERCRPRKTAHSFRCSAQHRRKNVSLPSFGRRRKSSCSEASIAR